MSQRRTTTAATAASAVVVMPAFLTGASSVFLRQDLEFNEAGLGLAIAAFFASSALASVPGGRIAGRLGARTTLAMAAGGTSAVLLGIAVLASNLATLVGLLALAGILNGIGQPATDLALARDVTVHPALMFGVKQSAVPLATLLAGASVPLGGTVLGWRLTFIVSAALAAVTALSLPWNLTVGGRQRWASNREGDAAAAPLVALAVAAGVGTGSATALATFLVESLVADGIDASAAGWLLMTASLLGIATRVILGWWADRKQGRALYTVAATMLAGGVGYVVLSLDTATIIVTLATLLAYVGGFGWSGLLNFAVVQLNPYAPARASGIVLTGAAAGAALGPLVFGYAIQRASFNVAWTLTAVTATVAAGLVLGARAWLLHDRNDRRTVGAS